MTEAEENIYILGRRSALTHALRYILSELGYEGSEAEHVKWISEREETVNILRECCVEFGDNDWSNDLHLGEVVVKHLVRHLWRNQKPA